VAIARSILLRARSTSWCDFRLDQYRIVADSTAIMRSVGPTTGSVFGRFASRLAVHRRVKPMM